MHASPPDRYQTAEALLADLRAVAANLHASGTQTIAPDVDRRVWWWQFHQLAMALVHAAMPLAAWFTRGTIGAPWGSRIFFATLIVATVSVTLRLNLWFTARVQPESLVDHRARVFPAIVAAELLLVGVLIAAAVFVGAAREEFAALIVIVAIASLASLVLIEPATTRAARLLRDRGAAARE